MPLTETCFYSRLYGIRPTIILVAQKVQIDLIKFDHSIILVAQNWLSGQLSSQLPKIDSPGNYHPNCPKLTIRATIILVAQNWLFQTNLINFDLVWSSLIKSDPVWSSLIQFDQEQVMMAPVRVFKDLKLETLKDFSLDDRVYFI